MPDYRYFVIGGVDSTTTGARIPAVDVGPFDTEDDALAAASDLIGRTVEEIRDRGNVWQWPAHEYGTIVGVTVERWRVTDRLCGLTDPGWVIHAASPDQLADGARAMCAQTGG